MESWKEFEQNPVTHSAAHHLVAIAELLGEFGYARVSDVARKLEITRGSVSVTLKALKQKGLVIEDEHRHLRLSALGERIARGVSAKKHVLKHLFTRVLGVSEAQAEVDTCKIEHLVSSEAARLATRLLRFLGSGAAEAQRFAGSYSRFTAPCAGDPKRCPLLCEDRCLEEFLSEPDPLPKEKG